MAKRKSSSKSSKSFFTLVVLSVSALGLMAITYASLQPTSTRSDAADRIDKPTSPIVAELRYDTNNNGAYERSDECPESGKFTFRRESYTFQGKASNDIKNTGCITNILTGQGEEKKYTIDLLGSAELSYMYIVYFYNDSRQETKIDNPKHQWPLDAGANKYVKVVYGIKDKSPEKPNPRQANCEPSISYHGSTGLSKSVKYNFSVNNNCNVKQTYRVWVNVHENGTTGWTYKFANGGLNDPIRKEIAAGKSGSATVEVSRANVKGLPRGNSKYTVTLKTALCKNDSCSVIDEDRADTYNTTYYVEN